MRISLAWWNTSLAPLGKSRATEEQINLALQMVTYLIKQMHIDCLALGEVTKEEISRFMELGQFEDYHFSDEIPKIGRLKHDTYVLYRKNILELINSKHYETRMAGHSMKVANRIDFRMPYSDRPLHVLVSHWPSRLYCERRGAKRHTLGMRLREAVEEINSMIDQAYIILMGDYNDDPSESSLEESLSATRDRKLAQKKPELLYNPFWRLLGEPNPYAPGELESGYAGSYYYSKDNITNWRTFDQIIFSSAFLGQNEWRLNERYSRIIQPNPFDSLVIKRDTIFDHFPVMSIIERESTDV